MIQGTDEWRLARCGKITASRLSDILATTKSGYSASRKNYLAELLVERLTNEPTEHFISREMQWGTDQEPEGRLAYELREFVDVETTGFIVHPQLWYSGASPDGLVGTNGGVEIKCPNTATHIRTILDNKVPNNHYCQIQWCMECTGRTWWDYVSYDPRVKVPALTVHVIRVQRNETFLAQARREVVKAHEEIEAMLSELTNTLTKPSRTADDIF